MEKLTEATLRWWPWLVDEPSTDDREQPEAESLEIERADYYGGPDRWIDWSDQPFYGPARGLWPLEAILGTQNASHAASAEVRGVPCTRYVGEVLPGEVAGQPGIKLIDPPNPHDDWRALTAEVCVDGSGLVRRIAWSPTTGKRFKPGLVPRLAMGLDGRVAADAASPSDGRSWNVVEFWDYGCEVEIIAPTNLITEGTPWREIIRDLWRMRHEYKQRSQAPNNRGGRS